MGAPRLLYYGFFAMLLSFFLGTVSGQVLVHGTVYDKSLYFALPGVSVMGTSGAGTATDSAGYYEIRLRPNDSIYFSYQGKATARFPIRGMDLNQPLNMSLLVTVDSLPQVIVRPRSYRGDSLENRREYEKIFNYGGADYLSGTRSPGSGGVGVGFDFDQLFSGRKNRRILAFQRRLVEEEQDRFVDHRFNKMLVRRITGLTSPALDTFMKLYRPSYIQILSFENDYEYYSYIRDWGHEFSEMWKKDHGG